VTGEDRVLSHRMDGN